MFAASADRKSEISFKTQNGSLFTHCYRYLSQQNHSQAKPTALHANVPSFLCGLIKKAIIDKTRNEKNCPPVCFLFYVLMVGNISGTKSAKNVSSAGWRHSVKYDKILCHVKKN